MKRRRPVATPPGSFGIVTRPGGPPVEIVADAAPTTALLHSSLNGGDWQPIPVQENATGPLQFERPITLAPDDWLTVGILTPDGAIAPMVSVHGRNAGTIKGLTLFGSPRTGA